MTVFRREYRFLYIETLQTHGMINNTLEGNMANSFSKLTSWLISLITAVAGVFMGWLLKFLMMIKDSECLDAINMSAETAVRIMLGLGLSVLIVSVQAIYLVLKNCKLEKQILLIKDRATVQKQEIEDAIIKMQYEYAEAEKTHIKLKTLPSINSLCFLN